MGCPFASEKFFSNWKLRNFSFYKEWPFSLCWMLALNWKWDQVETQSCEKEMERESTKSWNKTALQRKRIWNLLLNSIRAAKILQKWSHEMRQLCKCWDFQRHFGQGTVATCETAVPVTTILLCVRLSVCQWQWQCKSQCLQVWVKRKLWFILSFSFCYNSLDTWLYLSQFLSQTNQLSI